MEDLLGFFSTIDQCSCSSTTLALSQGFRLKRVSEDSHHSYKTDQSRESRNSDCTSGLECLLDVIRALRVKKHGNNFWYKNQNVSNLMLKRKTQRRMENQMSHHYQYKQTTSLNSKIAKKKEVHIILTRAGSSCSRRSLHGSSPRVPGPGGGVRRRRSSKRRSRSQSSSFDFNGDELSLHRIPGRMFLNGSMDAACLFSQQGKKGLNQDAMIFWENFGSIPDTVFCGVFDGHGPYGHIVAKRVRDLLPLKLSSLLEAYVSLEDVLKEINLNTADSKNSEDLAGGGENRVSIQDLEKCPDMLQSLKATLLKAFKFMDRELKMQRDVDCFCSGTTAVTLVKQGQHLVVGNIGDSRAVLGMRNDDNTLVAIQLTVDLKPDVPAEAERIRKCRGRVFAHEDEPGVARLWLPNHNSPGLAMARAFGDFCLKDFGLISVPEVSHRHLTEKDEFVVLATDGIWDALSNEEVVEIVAAAPTRSSAGRAVVEAAVRTWKWKFPTSKVDDCAVVCLFLDSEPNKLSTASSSSDDKDINKGGSESGKNDKEVVTSEESEQETLLTPETASTSDSGTDWSTLEGVSRVNTLVNLPR
ncbi:PREDICTED: probable protein phosphatase 2C 74 [Tarenaya hassleriana]|uniref:probable protein phosphatase 2C 74 n=1 Tax=Tarenaya hassleriana TaxID=28532 RepID=UPI00053C583E|nr:PREDICTED: probable protein phosphatase 2C 74 [Tarenaya hassleriana]